MCRKRIVLEKVTFASGGVMLCGDLYRPRRSGSHSGRSPGVVTAPGFGGVKEMLIPHYAAALAEEGIACLAFDYAGFGESEGTIRQHVEPRAQCRAYRDALDALAADRWIDPTRLGAWGTSLSGGHTLIAAASDPRVRAAVALIPFVGAPSPPEGRLAWAVIADGARRLLGGKRATIPAAGRPGSRAIMHSDGAADWMANVTRNAPNFRNEVTVASLWNMSRYTTAEAAAKVAIPLRVILATRDTITPAARVRAAFAKQTDLSHVDFVEFPETHFELFERHLAETVDLTVAWLGRHLTPTTSTPSVRSFKAISGLGS